jgi:hypothetical protein
MTEDELNNDPSLIKPVSEQVTTDAISDLKIGIYNLYVSLLNNLIASNGYEEAIRISTDFLDEISINFKNILKEES